MPTTITARVEVLPSTSAVFLDGVQVGFINHPTRNREHGRYAKTFIAYAYVGDGTAADFFDDLDAAAAFIAEAVTGGRQGAVGGSGEVEGIRA